MENRHVASEKHAASVIICLFNIGLATLVRLARGTGQTCRTATKWQMYPRQSWKSWSSYMSVLNG